jgi:hypothetical protein
LAEKNLTEKAINMVKDKMKMLCSDAAKKMRRNGMAIPKA